MPLPVSHAYKWRTLSAAATVMTLELSAAPLPTQDRTRAAGISRSCVRPHTLCPGVFVFYKRQMADKEKNDRQLDSIGACGVPARVRTTLRHRDPPSVLRCCRRCARGAGWRAALSRFKREQTCCGMALSLCILATVTGDLIRGACDECGALCQLPSARGGCQSIKCNIALDDSLVLKASDQLL